MFKRLFLFGGMVGLAVGTAAIGRTAWQWHLPLQVAAPSVPADNPMSLAKVELGRRLFYDADLSFDGTMSCGTCHQQKHGFTDGNATRPGVHGDPGRRNIPGLANVAYLSPLTWADPRQTTLEKQAAVPVFGLSPVEMGMDADKDELARRLSRDPCYVRMFREAFPETRGAIDFPSVSKALAAFERTLISFDAPYDRYRRGDESALSGPAKNGADLFQRHCTSCHSGADMTDANYHRIENAAGRSDQGLSEVTGSVSDAGKFRTPGLRNVAVTGPYMHDGSALTINDAIARHALAAPVVRDFSASQWADLSAFLASLTDPDFLGDRKFAAPNQACGRSL